jgi:hypothetical protein
MVMLLLYVRNVKSNNYVRSEQAVLAMFDDKTMRMMGWILNNHSCHNMITCSRNKYILSNIHKGLLRRGRDGFGTYNTMTDQRYQVSSLKHFCCCCNIMIC